jgi:hypothetical protein
MKPKVKQMNRFVKFLVFNSVIGITLAPFGIYIREGYFRDKTINHEKIHWKQQMEMLILPFYIWYITEFIIRIFINGNNAYRKISFEQEAYKHENDFNYIGNRKKFSWLKFL